jgi:hypothetical protein
VVAKVVSYLPVSFLADHALEVTLDQLANWLAQTELALLHKQNRHNRALNPVAAAKAKLLLLQGSSINSVSLRYSEASWLGSLVAKDSRELLRLICRQMRQHLAIRYATCSCRPFRRN